VSDRAQPLPVEQALLRCEECGELLAIIDTLGDHTAVTYLWHPGNEDDAPPPRCHENGVTAWQAERAYRDDHCQEYFQSEVTGYTWPEREPVLNGPDFPAEEPEPDPVESVQLALEVIA
jgi:hypothetical protein